MPQRAFGQNRRMGPRERSELFTARKLRSPLFCWTDVNVVDLLTAFTLAHESKATLSFAPAAGGNGVVLKLWQGKIADDEFAGSPEELNELLSLLIEGFASSSEDPRAVIRLGLSKSKQI